MVTGIWNVDQSEADVVNQHQQPHTCHRPRLHVHRSAMAELISSILENIPNSWHLAAGGPISDGMEVLTNARTFAFVLLKTREDMMMRVRGQGTRGASEMQGAPYLFQKWPT